jgi:hypothetical protein
MPYRLGGLRQSGSQWGGRVEELYILSPRFAERNIMNDVLKSIQREKEEILNRKGHDYKARINGVPIDNLKIAGLPGIAVRILDKATRALSLTLGRKTPAVTNKSLRDTFLDVSNYGDLGVMFVDGTYDAFRPGDPDPDESEIDNSNGSDADPDEGEEPDKVNEQIMCFHSRNMYRIAESKLPTERAVQSQVAFIDTGSILSVDPVRTPEGVLQDLSRLVAKADRIYVIWDGNDMFIPMIVGMAMALEIPVTSGHVDFPQGHPSRVHTLINSLPPLE